MRDRSEIRREVERDAFEYVDGDAENGPRVGVRISEADIEAEVVRRVAVEQEIDSLRARIETGPGERPELRERLRRLEEGYGAELGDEHFPEAAPARTAAQEARSEAREEIVSDLRAAAARLEAVAARAREVAESIRVAGLRGDEHFADRVVVHNVPETLRDLATPLAGTAAANLDYAIRMVAQVAAGDRGSLAPETTR